ncbi:uridine kinase family protein [Dapis sp. BLCC M172]|uniref:uridine kinase family protein n=1 Tax=Dapis sp. BLCC M172 TaxID=2975281 RepID=UPI003CF643EB
MENLINTLSEKSQNTKPLMVAVSGIDGSGKGYIGSQINSSLQEIGINSYLIGIDGWLELPEKRFSNTNPAEHFYNNGLRFTEMFSTLVAPLQQTGSIDLIANHADASNSNSYTQYHYQIDNAEIVILEGIFLFQNKFNFDYRIWIYCSFETAFKRALNRNQEGISEVELRQDYETIYFPAQRLHFAQDKPKQMADFIIVNDDKFKEY